MDQSIGKIHLEPNSTLKFKGIINVIRNGLMYTSVVSDGREIDLVFDRSTLDSQRSLKNGDFITYTISSDEHGRLSHQIDKSPVPKLTEAEINDIDKRVENLIFDLGNNA